MSEQKIQKEIIKYLKTVSYVVRVVQSSKNGVPDIICCYRGRFVAFEVKADEKKEPSELQNYNLQNIINFKGFAFVVRSVDDVIFSLNDIDDVIFSENLNVERFIYGS